MAEEKEWHVFLKPVPKEKVFEVDIKGILDKFMQEGKAFKAKIEKAKKIYSLSCKIINFSKRVAAAKIRTLTFKRLDSSSKVIKIFTIIHE